jgi:hypothetical protein
VERLDAGAGGRQDARHRHPLLRPGSVPAFVVHGPQRNAAKETVVDALAAALAAEKK